jgi:uncharacterized 2Fe-2S/4Fe-4S cluster protein (DUF4445 family)
MSRIVFTPSGRRGDIPDDSSLLDAARLLGVDLDSVCGGRGICGRCQVVPMEGEFPKHGIASTADHLIPFTEPEERYRERSGLAADRRLGCHARIRGDLVIDVPPESQIHRQVVRKEADAHPIEVDPIVTLHYVEIEQPSLDRAEGDLQRLLAALERDWSLTGLDVDPIVLPGLQRTLRAEWTATVAVREERLITAVFPGFHDVALGVAFDVGSTTVAGHLCDLRSGEVLASAGAMNPQIRFGEDLMSRVSYVMLHPGGDAEMTAAVRACLDQLVGELCEQVDAHREDVLELAIVGNPIMHHLVFGFDPTQLGTAPFTLVTDHALTVPARDLGIGANLGARAYALPLIAGHVGADTAGVILSEAPYDQDMVNLIVDVGTNAEIVLGNRDRLLAASSPTGPAFEGAQISCGQRAAPGAIERVRIDRDTLALRYRTVGSDAWSDEPGAPTPTGICGSGIIELVAELYLAGILSPDGLFDPAAVDRTDRLAPDGRTYGYVLHEAEPRLVLTQTDVRQIQLAKGALYAGCRLLMDHYGIDRADRIRLAGAFGAHIDPVHAMVLGLVPDCAPTHVTSAGNAAGTGARIALLNRAARVEIEDVVGRVEKIETATEPRFQEHFVGAMGIPHATDPFPRLAEHVGLPERPSTVQRSRHRRTRSTT